MVGQRSKRSAIPFDHGSHELGDDDAAAGGEKVEDRTEREPHAEAANEDGWRVEQSRMSAAKGRQRLLGAVHPARHQALAVSKDDVFARVAGESQVGAVWRPRFAEQLPGSHERLTRWGVEVQLTYASVFWPCGQA